ncbi:hypothetical protein [Photorhabdus heterorhabditis]|uniref:hypothetical protein n=1 Tax=Photorhabdus heterorhabditis TaxID=880156 RepID=UPI001562CEDF|nr:hypothetical protein [Photorhabdus heterorhabditis]NRN30517.1 hypothetical protein [Photorhabdus heterorhabditis subsp. aluminescens]
MLNNKYSEKVNHSGNRDEKGSIHSNQYNMNSCTLGLGLDLPPKRKLRIGDERNIKDAQPFISSPAKQKQYSTSPIAMSDILSESALTSQPIITDLINPQKIKMSEGVRNILNNKEGGGNLVFKALKIKPSDETLPFNALKIVDTWQEEMPDQDMSILAYWAPQGGYVDIPAQPDLSRHPQYVFTPGFSGCSFVVDKMNKDILRVRHVQGGQEDVEYNNQNIDHGMGMMSAMEFRDYGYHEADGKVMENTYGFAFLKFNPEKKQWQLHYQKIAAAPNIINIKTESSWLPFSKTSIEANTFISKDMKVSGYNRRHITGIK